MKLSDWIAAQRERDTLRLLAMAFARPRVGTTGPDLKTRPRGIWEVQRRKALRYVMTHAGLVFAELQNALTVRNKIVVWVRNLATVNDKTDALSTYIPVFWIAYVDFRDRDVSGEDDDAETYDAGSLPVYGDSPAVANGWTDLINASDDERGTVVEAAQ